VVRTIATATANVVEPFSNLLLFRLANHTMRALVRFMNEVTTTFPYLR
jgi:hypothetical protein